ncbi:MAG: hypothetical protein H6742_15480 [Alphaproteobacteria bacterium]|nr:hypothetical protein [Alphaproteobacteria bacterium]
MNRSLILAATPLLLAGLLVACGDKEDGGTDTGAGTTDTDTDTDTDGDGGGGAAFEDYINVTSAPTGDLDSCCPDGSSSSDGGSCWESGDWRDESPDPSAQRDTDLLGDIYDFETGDPVDTATLDLWFSNDPTAGAPDYSVIGDGDGVVTSTYKTCTPIAYRVRTDPDLEATVDTYEINQISSFTEGTVQEEFNSVSTATYAIIPSLLGVSPDADKGVIAGTAYDCGGDPIEGAQVVVRDSSGNIPESLVVKYFVDEFPNRNQEYTSPDGLWVAINVPEGDWNIELYVADGAGGHRMVGSSQAPVFPESILISNIYTGYSNGQKFPANCLAGG